MSEPALNLADGMPQSAIRREIERDAIISEVAAIIKAARQPAVHAVHAALTAADQISGRRTAPFGRSGQERAALSAGLTA